MLKLLKRFNLPHDDLITIFSGFVSLLQNMLPPYGILVFLTNKQEPWREFRKGHVRSSWVKNFSGMTKHCMSVG
jgi:hypothetical protein